MPTNEDQPGVPASVRNREPGGGSGCPPEGSARLVSSLVLVGWARRDAGGDGGQGGDGGDGFGEQGQAAEEVVVPVGWVNVEVERVGFGQAVSGLAQLLPALLVRLAGRVLTSVELEPPTVELR